MLSNNDIINCGENWYEFHYYSYKDGCNCIYKMPESEYKEFEEKFNRDIENMHQHKLKTVQDYIKTCLSLNA